MGKKFLRGKAYKCYNCGAVFASVRRMKGHQCILKQLPLPLKFEDENGKQQKQ